MSRAVQMLATFWAPLALLGLHAYIESGQRRWLVLYGAAWVLQGAANGYALVMFSVLVGLWALWFVIVSRKWHALGMIALATIIAVLPLAPVLYRYTSVHSQFGFVRGYWEIRGFSADIAGLLCAPPLLTFWGWVRVKCGPEGELFPGVALLLLSMIGLVGMVVRSSRSESIRSGTVVTWFRRVMLFIAAVYTIVILVLLVSGPFMFEIGALRVQVAGTANAVLKVVPRAHPDHLDETLRARRVVEHMRRRGYPTPAWLAVGATATHVWHLMDFVDAAPAPELAPSLVEQLMEIIELQAGQASEPYDHWSYAWRVATGQEPAVAGLSGYSPVVSALVERLRLVCADVPPPPESPDMVHADLNPSNVLVRDGAVVAVVDIGNAGSGTRATDLTTLVWYTFQDPLLDGVRRRLWTRILDLVGWDGAAVLAAAQILHMLEIPIRHGRHDVVPGVVKRGHRALDELNALR